MKKVDFLKTAGSTIVGVTESIDGDFLVVFDNDTYSVIQPSHDLMDFTTVGDFHLVRFDKSELLSLGITEESLKGNDE